MDDREKRRFRCWLVCVCTCTYKQELLLLLLLLLLCFVAGGTETYAVPCDTSDTNHTHRLYGYKWFSSATDADMAFTLARVWDSNGMVTEVCMERKRDRLER